MAEKDSHTKNNDTEKRLADQAGGTSMSVSDLLDIFESLDFNADPAAKEPKPLTLAEKVLKNIRGITPHEIEPSSNNGEQEHVPVQGDFFVLDLLDASFGSDMDSMDAPYFALNGNDLQEYKWTSVNGNIEVTIRPPGSDDTKAKPRSEKDDLPSRYKKKSDIPARATIHDKDILIYLASCLYAQLKTEGNSLPDDNRVLMTPHGFFSATTKQCGKEAYVRLRDALERLARTYVSRREKNKKTGEWGKERGFTLIAEWDAVIDQNDDRNSSIQVTLSGPFAEAIKTKKVLKLHENYFALRKGLAKALYLAARYHCRQQLDWTIALSKLKDRVGSRDVLRNFREQIRKIIKDGGIPDYEMQLTTSDEVVFYNISGNVKLPPLKIKPIRRKAGATR